MPVIPATWEAEAEELLEPNRGRGCSEPRPRHCTPTWETPSQKIIIIMTPTTKRKIPGQIYPLTFLGLMTRQMKAYILYV